VAARVVDNTPPRGTDIQGANGGVAGRLDAGDTLTLGYSEAIAPASVLAGWTGAATAIKLSLSNTGGNDHLALLTTAGARLPLLAAGQDIALGANFVNGSGATFDATMALSGSNVVITVGAATVGSSRSNVGGTNPMSWSPGTSVTDLAGNPCAATAVTESGALDVDF
jgi:hypothetical protein